MPFPSACHLFENGLRNTSQPSYLDTLIRQQLELVSRSFYMDAPHHVSAGGPDDMVSDIGEYLTRTSILWAQLTEHLIKGPHINQASYRAHEKSQQQSHMSNLAELAKIDVDIGRLQKIRDLSFQFSSDVLEAWRPQVSTANCDESVFMQHSISPFCDAKVSFSESMSFSNGNDAPQFASSRLVAGKNQMSQTSLDRNGGDVTGSDESSDDDEQFQSIDMEALRQRGKGLYLCPKGHRCDKGGVDKDGNLVIFDRNSSFAQHCNKHRKPWRCDVPGCPNPPKKRRFARRDGLERHKSTVKHYVVK